MLDASGGSDRNLGDKSENVCVLSLCAEDIASREEQSQETSIYVYQGLEDARWRRAVIRCFVLKRGLGVWLDARLARNYARKSTSLQKQRCFFPPPPARAAQLTAVTSSLNAYHRTAAPQVLHV